MSGSDNESATGSLWHHRLNREHASLVRVHYPKMRLRSAASLLAGILLAAASRPAFPQGRLIDEGTFVITKAGSPSQTESFRIRSEGSLIIATGQSVVGSRRTVSSLTADSLGSPMRYDLTVFDNGVRTLRVQVQPQSGRFSALSSDARGNESMTEYPAAAGRSVILEDDLVHQSYLLVLGKQSGNVQVIEPHGGHRAILTLSALGPEAIEIGGRSVTATHYSLSNSLGRRDVWIDPAGRLLKVETSQGLKAVRDELPR
jgi:hypothetical protein